MFLFILKILISKLLENFIYLNIFNICLLFLNLKSPRNYGHWSIVERAGFVRISFFEKSCKISVVSVVLLEHFRISVYVTHFKCLIHSELKN